MSDPNIRARLKQVADLYKAGQKGEARRLISEIVKANPNDADAWYIAGQVLDETPKKIKAFERALAVNPAHQAARKALDDLRDAQSLLDDVLSEEAVDEDFREFFPAEPSEAPRTARSTSSSPTGRIDLSDPKMLVGVIGGTLVVGILLGALCLSTISSGKFLGVVIAPTLTPSKTPTATPTFTPTRTPTPTDDIIGTATGLAATQQIFDATSTAKALLSEQALTATGIALVNQQIETAIVQTNVAQGNQVVAVVTAAALEQATIPPTWTLPADNIVVQPSPTVVPPVDAAYLSLPANLIDADYSAALDRIILISENPNQLHIFNPQSGDDLVVELSRVPKAVGVGPDGLFAAVGHDAKLSYVDLQNARVVTTLDVAADVGEVALGGNGWIYVAPSRDQWENLRAVNIASNTEMTGGMIYAGAALRMHPDGLRVYTSTRGLSPGDIERFDLTDGVPMEGHDSRYHGDYDTCGDVWFSADGSRIFTPCGTVFRSSAVLDQDMIYNGTLPDMPYIAYIVHAPSINRLIGISGGDNALAVWDYESYSTIARVTLPDFVINGQSSPVRGRYLFVNPGAAQFYAIVQSGQNDLYSYNPDTSAPVVLGLLVGDLPG